MANYTDRHRPYPQVKQITQHSGAGTNPDDAGLTLPYDAASSDSSLCSSVSLCLCGEEGARSPRRHRDAELHRENAFVQKLLLVKVGKFSLEKPEVGGLLHRWFL